MSSASVVSRGSSRGASRTVRFRRWALIERPVATLGQLFAAAVAATALAAADGRWWTAIIAILLVLMLTWTLWLPIDWELSPRGIRQRIGPVSRQLAWHEIGQLEFGKNGLRIRPALPSPWIAALRTLHVPYPPEQVEFTKSLIVRWTEGESEAGRSYHAKSVE